MYVYSIRDLKAEAGLLPFFDRNHETALRKFRRAVNDVNSDFHAYYEDYVLFCVGTWNEDEMKLEPLEVGCISLATGLSLMKEKERIRDE